jgi:hypothetical protein
MNVKFNISQSYNKKSEQKGNFTGTDAWQKENKTVSKQEQNSNRYGQEERKPAYQEGRPAQRPMD